ncbi:MAG TPA: hypothetical protein VFR24_27380 [Candidatus Angelobacter sp.]|nr:hypothetical protein [Candidatus Angelobacter sp.]
MPLTLLQIVQAAQGELGLPQSSSVINNTDATTVQMYNLANRVVDIVRRWKNTRWTALQTEYNIVVSPPISVTGTVTLNSPIITNISPNTNGIIPWIYACSGNAIPQAARVLTVDSSSQVTLTMENTGPTASNLAIIFAKDTYPMPTDFDYYNNRTMWDRTNRWELLGPDSPQIDQWHRSGIVATGPRRHFRQLGPVQAANAAIPLAGFRLWPAPVEIVSPLQIDFEYLSNAAVKQIGPSGFQGIYTKTFTNDTDQSVLDDQAVIMGIKWMFWQVKGFNYADMKNDWMDYVNALSARDGGAQTLQMVRRQDSVLLTSSNIQDGFFPGPVASGTN